MGTLFFSQLYEISELVVFLSPGHKTPLVSSATFFFLHPFLNAMVSRGFGFESFCLLYTLSIHEIINYYKFKYFYDDNFKLIISALH